MKNLATILIALSCLLQGNLYAQCPNSFNYQAVIRDASGNILADQPVSIRMSINKESADGTLIYQESHSTTTNDFGLVTLIIGSGTPSSGDMNNVEWGDDIFFLKTEIINQIQNPNRA